MRSRIRVLVLFFALASAVTGVRAAAPPEPPNPKPSPALNAALSALGKDFDRARVPEYIRIIDEAERRLPPTAGPVDRAYLHEGRTLLLLYLGRPAAAAAEALRAAREWHVAGDGPGEVLGLAVAGALRYELRPEEGDRLLRRAMELARSEKRRPMAARKALEHAAAMALARGPFAAGKFDPARVDLAKLKAGILSPGIARPTCILALAVADLELAHDPDWSDVAKTIGLAATVALLEGDLSAARLYHERALAVEEAHLGPEAVVDRLKLLGICAQAQGDLAAADRYFGRAVDHAVLARLTPLSISEARILRGVLLRMRGDFAGARDVLLQAWRERAGATAPPEAVAEALLNLMLVSLSQGDAAGALQQGQQALDLLDGIRDLDKTSIRGQLIDRVRGVILTNMGTAALTQNRLSEARDYLRRARELQERRDPAGPDAALILANLGAIELQLGALDRSRAYFQQALRIGRGPVRIGALELICYTNLGVIALKQGDLSRAESYLQHARAIQERRAPGSPEVSSTLHDLAYVASLRHNLPRAARLEADAWRLALKQPLIAAEAQEGPAVASSQAMFSAALALYEFRQHHWEHAFAVAEAGRARALQQLLGERRTLLRAAGGATWTAYQQAIAAANVASERLAQAVSAEDAARDNARAARAGPAGERAAAGALLAARTRQNQSARTEYVARAAERDRLAAEVTRRAPRAFPRPVSLAEARLSLPADRLAVSFSVGEQGTLLFLIRPAAGTTRHGPPAPGLSVFWIPVTPAALRAEVERFRAVVSRPGTAAAEAESAGRRLFTRLFPPAAAAEIRRASRVLISPDDVLWEVSFAALVTNARGAPRYLGEKPLTYAQSLTLFQASQKEIWTPASDHRVTALVVGNPQFETGALPSEASLPGERSFLLSGRAAPPPLPGAEAEAREVSSLYGCTPLLGAAATEEAVRERLPAAEMVHFATHFYLDPERPMSSGLLLAAPSGAQTESATERDGVLQAWELFSQFHLHADLVVLSACESGRGASSRGSGLVGVTSALQYAGARSVIASQWRVADERTGRLMLEFHRNVRRGLPKDRALAAAMAALRGQADSAHPYYWAPFLLVGDPETHLARLAPPAAVGLATRRRLP